MQLNHIGNFIDNLVRNGFDVSVLMLYVNKIFKLLFKGCYIAAVFSFITGT